MTPATAPSSITRSSTATPSRTTAPARAAASTRMASNFVRGSAKLYPDEISESSIGIVTSGGFGPTVQAPIAMGYVDKTLATTGTRIFGEVRGKRVALRVCDLPFVPHRYKRNRN